MRRAIEALRRTRRRWLRWVAEHDDRWSFTLLYVGLALVLSMAISLFWLVVVVLAHGVLEWFALGRRGVRDRRLGRVIWHLKLDLGLVLGALWLGLYLDVLFGIAGVGAVARGGAQATARFLAWQRAVRGVLLGVDDAALVLRAAAARARGGAAPDGAAEAERAEVPWRRRWGLGDRLAVGLAAVFALLILWAPLLTDHSVASALITLAAELHPWPAP